MGFVPNWQTQAVIGVFAALYLLVLLRRAARDDLDLYDVLLLSLVAILPTGFVFFPELATAVASITGVAFPFVVMFGVLFLVIFFFLHRLTRRLHRVQNQTRRLFQELSLRDHQMKELGGSRPTRATDPQGPNEDETP